MNKNLAVEVYTLTHKKINHTMVFILLKTISRKIKYFNPDLLCVRCCVLNTQSAFQQSKPKIRLCFCFILGFNLIMAGQIFLGLVGTNIKSINKCSDN